jgi:hypothetical protein
MYYVCASQIYEIEAKLVLDPTQVKPGKRDFAAAMRDLTPAAHRYVPLLLISQCIATCEALVSLDNKTHVVVA